MKNPLFLINLIFISIYAQFAFAEQRDVYSQAQEAYRKNDCHSTIKLLRDYLISERPTNKRLASIYSAIGWCETYLNLGQSTYYINGHDGADEEITVDSEFGIWMKSNIMPMR